MADLLIALALLAAADPPAELGDIRMQLFYEETGRLSPDISPPNAFVGANTIIGEGDAEEAANDLLVTIELRTQGQQSIDTPVHIVARNEDGLVLRERDHIGTLTSRAGRAILPLWLNNIGCANEIRVEVTFGTQRRTETLNLPCRE